jgi:hypothetical protein
MNTLDFNIFLKNVDGTDTEAKLSKSLSEFLASETQGPALKLLGWVERLSKGEILEVDEADEDLLKKTIETSNRMTVLLRGQLLRVFIKK